MAWIPFHFTLMRFRWSCWICFEWQLEENSMVASIFNRRKMLQVPFVGAAIDFFQWNTFKIVCTHFVCANDVILLSFEQLHNNYVHKRKRCTPENKTQYCAATPFVNSNVIFSFYCYQQYCVADLAYALCYLELNRSVFAWFLFWIWHLCQRQILRLDFNWAITSGRSCSFQMFDIVHESRSR